MTWFVPPCLPFYAVLCCVPRPLSKLTTTQTAQPTDRPIYHPPSYMNAPKVPCTVQYTTPHHLPNAPFTSPAPQRPDCGAITAGTAPGPSLSPSLGLPVSLGLVCGQRPILLVHGGRHRPSPLPLPPHPPLVVVSSVARVARFGWVHRPLLVLLSAVPVTE
jgi:hypothetical protein